MDAQIREMQIADEILRELGGAIRLGSAISVDQFVTMQGGVNVLGGVMFRFKASSIVNSCLIYLNCDGTYTVRFAKVSNYGMTIKIVYNESGICCDQLPEIFERETGLNIRG